MGSSARDDGRATGARDSRPRHVIDGPSEGHVRAHVIVVTSDGDHSGELTADGTVDVTGTVAGVVRGGLVRIHVGGSVVGEVHAGILRVSGGMVGLCHAANVEAGDGAVLRGVVVADTVALAPGAVLSAGSCIGAGNYRDRNLVSRARDFLAAEGLAPDPFASRVPAALATVPEALPIKAPVVDVPVDEPEVEEPEAAPDDPGHPPPLAVEALAVGLVEAEAPAAPHVPRTPAKADAAVDAADAPLDEPDPSPEPSPPVVARSEGDATAPNFRRRRRLAVADGADLPPAIPPAPTAEPVAEAPAGAVDDGPAPDPATAIDAMGDYFAPRRGDARVSALADAFRASAAGDGPVQARGATGGDAGRRAPVRASEEVDPVTAAPPREPDPIPPAVEPPPSPAPRRPNDYVRPFLIAPRER